MNYIGISAGFHDAAITLLDDNGNILFAGHSERYNKHKHTKHLNIDIVKDALSYATSHDIEIHYYERPLLKYLRQWRSEKNQYYLIYQPEKSLVVDTCIK